MFNWNPLKSQGLFSFVEFWIEVARECVNIGNFNSMMGIISGITVVTVPVYFCFGVVCLTQYSVSVYAYA
jgi:hypothetical protein